MRFHDLSGIDETKLGELVELATGDKELAHDVMVERYKKNLEAQIQAELAK